MLQKFFYFFWNFFELGMLWIRNEEWGIRNCAWGKIFLREVFIIRVGNICRGDLWSPVSPRNVCIIGMSVPYECLCLMNVCPYGMTFSLGMSASARYVWLSHDTFVPIFCLSAGIVKVVKNVLRFVPCWDKRFIPPKQAIREQTGEQCSPLQAFAG